MVRVLIVNDSPAVADLLGRILAADGEIQVTGIARDGMEAVDLALSRQPDVVIMDIHMPRMNGFEATKQIMERAPKPVIIVNELHDTRDVELSLQAMEAGALALLAVPVSVHHPDYESSASELVKMVKLMSEVRVVRRWAKKEPAAGEKPPVRPVVIKVVAIGASTGGPLALETLLKQLPGDFPAPVLVVQHIMPGFLEGVAAWLDSRIDLPVSIARNLEPALPAHVYIAPDGHQMGIGGGRIRLVPARPGENGGGPSVSFLFRSVAESYGDGAAAVLLTGMGEDGAEELLALRQAGALTLVQDKESSVVFGMPGKAQALGAAQYVSPPQKIAAILANAIKK